MARIDRIVAVLMVLAATILGLLPVDAARARAAGGSQTVRVSGRVTRPDGRPAAGAAVALLRFRTGPVVVRTDGQGRYSADLPSPFGTLMQASLPGVGVSHTIAVRPAPGQTRIECDLRLMPIPVLTGTVFLPDGTPAANIALDSQVEFGRDVSYPPWLHPPWSSVSGSTEVPPLGIQTDADGRYRRPLPVLEDDVLSEWGRYRGYLVSPRGLGWAELPEIVLDLGKPVLQQDLHLQTGERIRGQVVAYPGGAGKPGVTVEGRVWMGPHWRPMFVQTMTDAEGRFELAAALPPKSYEVAIRPGEGWGIMGMERKPGSAAGTTEIRVSLVHEYTVQGKVLRPDGQPLANADLSVAFQGLRPQGNGQPVWQGWSSGGDLHTDAEGRYSFARQADGMPWGEGPSLDGYLLLAVRARGIGVAAPVLVDATTPPPHVADIRLQAPGRVTGRIMRRADGRPAEGTRVAIGPLLPRPEAKDPTWMGEPFYDASTSRTEGDATGGFDLRDVAPGRYRLEVQGHTIRELIAKNGTALTITVGPGETLDLGEVGTDCVPHFSGRLSGGPDTLEDYDVKCILWPSDGTGPAREAEIWTGPSRDYTVWAYERAPGRYDGFVLAQKDTRRYISPVFRRLSLGEASPPSGVDLSFGNGATMSGRLVGADGQAVIGGGVVVQPKAGDALRFRAQVLEGWDGGGIWTQVAADKQGRFFVTGLLPGRYDLRAIWPRSSYGESKTLKLRLAENEHKEVGVIKASRRPPG
jgi:hypothetical protein